MTTSTNEPEVEQTVNIHHFDIGKRDPKGYYGPDVVLLLMDDGSVRWEYDSDD